MGIDNLYAELGLDFQPEERTLFFDEMVYAAQNYSSSLGHSVQKESDRSQVFERLMKKLDEETAEFSPVHEIYPLRKKHFTDQGLEESPHIASLMRRFNFYLVHFPITLVPRSGWSFIQLDCIIEFNPDRPAAERPVAYQIFPEEEWQDMIHFQQGVAVGLDANLEFKVDQKRLEVDLPGLSAAERAKVGLKAAATGGLLLGPFNYHIRRPKIISKGRGNVQVRWRLESEKYFEQEEPRLGIVLQVPKGVSRVDAVGVLKACKDFNVFTADIRHLLGYVKERTRNFFNRGAPKSHKQPWDDITGGL